MEHSIIYKIIRKYLSNRFLPETEKRVQKWLTADKDKEEKDKASAAYWNELNVKAGADTYAALKRVNRKIGYGNNAIPAFRQKMVRIAAILLPLLFIAGGYIYYSSTAGKLIEVSVAYGEQKYILLPDSSEIWLNAGTVFKYPEEFTGRQRRVVLNGEAYFAVRKNPKKPFIVEASNLSVKVLGTRFNIKAYANDDRITTTLTSGKVEVEAPANNPQILQPDEQLTYHKGTSQISITKIPSADTDGWVQGKLIFTNATFAEMQHTLERRFNVNISNRIAAPATGRYTARFLRGEGLDEVLNILGDIVGFGYRKNGTNIELINKP